MRVYKVVGHGVTTNLLLLKARLQFIFVNIVSLRFIELNATYGIYVKGDKYV